jgi:hypothetical protein
LLFIACVVFCAAEGRAPGEGGMLVYINQSYSSCTQCAQDGLLPARIQSMVVSYAPPASAVPLAPTCCNCSNSNHKSCTLLMQRSIPAGNARHKCCATPVTIATHAWDKQHGDQGHNTVHQRINPVATNSAVTCLNQLRCHLLMTTNTSAKQHCCTPPLLVVRSNT